MPLKTIILAAGQGTRMRSSMPKVLHEIASKPLLGHVYETANSIPDNHIAIVYGHGGEQLLNTLGDWPVKWFEQTEQLGTGHAVEQALGHIEDSDQVVILYGDVPLLRRQTIIELLQALEAQSVSLLTIDLDNPFGYGRIVRDASGKVTRIVEEKDATDREKSITETNTGVMAVGGADLRRWIDKLENNNAQNEFYLTDIIALAVGDGFSVNTVHPQSPEEVAGVNTRQQLAVLERAYQMNHAQQLMEQGVTLVDPSRFDLRGTIVAIGQDVVIDINVVLQGDIKLGNRVQIGPNCCLTNVVIEDDSVIEANSVVQDAHIGTNNVIGPFARIRPGTCLAEDVKVGNFVEVKKSNIGKGSKVNHLSYIGDSDIGEQVNVGAGTITCNYDGANKFKTIIKDGAFIGSDTQLVAPVVVGKNATIGAGSTITRDAPDDALTLTRSKQQSIHNWKRPQKDKK